MTDPNTFFNTTMVGLQNATIINGTMTPGVFQTLTEVYGMDLVVSLLIIIAFFQIMTFGYMLFGRNLRRLKK
jgi:ABC-type xylose transport system permease subunit